MTEDVKLWLKELFEYGIADAEMAANTEHIFAASSDSEDEAIIHINNEKSRLKYAEVLKAMTVLLGIKSDNCCNKTAVIISNSGSVTSDVHMFNGVEQAKRFLKDAYEYDLKVLSDNNELRINASIDPCGYYASIIVNSNIITYTIGAVHE